MKRRITLGRTWRGIMPDLAPLAGVILALISFFLLTTFFRQPARGLVSLETTPHLIGNSCINVADNTETIISLTADGRVSFAIADTTLQAAVFKQVGAKHHIAFTASQLTKLSTLSYLATTTERIAEIPAHSSATYRTQVIDQKKSALSTWQLVEYATAARLLAPTVMHYPTNLLLYIDAETDATKVMNLLAAFQAHGITRFLLVGHGSRFN